MTNASFRTTLARMLETTAPNKVWKGRIIMRTFSNNQKSHQTVVKGEMAKQQNKKTDTFHEGIRVSWETD